MGIESRVQDCGCLTKDELYELAYWKSHRSDYWILENSDDFVKEITSSALSANNDWEKLMTLTALQGVREPVASNFTVKGNTLSLTYTHFGLSGNHGK